MRIIREFLIGISHLAKAYRFVGEQRLWPMMLWPALVNALILGTTIWAAWHYTADFSFFLSEWFGIGEAELWWEKALEWTVIIVVRLLTALIFIKFYKYLMLLLLSPWLSWIGGTVQDRLHGSEQPFQLAQVFKDAIRGVVVALRSLFWELLLLILLLGLSFIPILSPFTAIALLLVEWYFLGLSMADIRHEYKKLSPKESFKVSRKRMGATLGIGGGMYLVMFIPLIGVLVAPMLSVVSAGLVFYKLEDESQAK